MFAKQKRIRDKRHLEFIRGLPCVKCKTINIKNQACHIRLGADGGIGIKPSDCFVVPMCPYHHNEQHRIGEKSFYKDINEALGLAYALCYEIDDNREAAVKLIKEFEV